MQKVSALESFGGASSARKIAEPTPRGTAISSESSEVTHVPNTNGRAPKSPTFGSHTCVNRKCHPNFVRGNPELIHNSYTSSAVTRRIAAAHTLTINRAIS